MDTVHTGFGWVHLSDESWYVGYVCLSFETRKRFAQDPSAVRSVRLYVNCDDGLIAGAADRRHHHWGDGQLVVKGLDLGLARFVVSHHDLDVCARTGNVPPDA